MTASTGSHSSASRIHDGRDCAAAGNGRAQTADLRQAAARAQGQGKAAVEAGEEGSPQTGRVERRADGRRVDGRRVDGRRVAGRGVTGRRRAVDERGRGPGSDRVSGAGSLADELTIKPRLRGVLHEGAFFASIVVAPLLLLSADASRARIAAAIFAASMTTCFGVSALYHRVTWSPPAR